MRSIKCVVIGDGAVGKTSLLISYTTNTFPTDYIPTVFDNYTTTLSVDPPTSNTGPINSDTNHYIPPETKERKSSTDDLNLFKLNLWDTAGQEEYDRLRPLSYPQTDIFLLCFAVNELTSFKNLNDKWIPELKQHANIENNIMFQDFNKLPILLIGTKSDLKEDDEDDNGNSQKCVEREDIENFVENNKLLGYVECSAKNQTGITEIFQTAVQKLVYEYDTVYLKSQQQYKKESTPVQEEHKSKSTDNGDQLKHTTNGKKLENTNPSTSDKKKSKHDSTGGPAVKHGHYKKSSSVQTNPSKHNQQNGKNNKNNNTTSSTKKNKRKTSCIIM